jgi:hypothetical protein
MQITGLEGRMNKKTETSNIENKTPEKDYVQIAVDGWNSSWEYASGAYHQNWQDMADLYDSKRVMVGYNGISDTFVPMSFSTVETMVAATAGDKPLVEFMQTKPEQATNVEVLNGLFSYYWDLDNWTNKLITHSRIFFKIGTSVLFVYWNIDHPEIKVVPLRDFFIDPTATILNYQNARYMGYRFLADIDSLKAEQVINPETQEVESKYQNLDKVTGGYSSGDETDKEYKDTHMGSTLSDEAQKNQVEVICYWTKEEVWYVANRTTVIYKSKNYFKERQQFLGWENPTGMYPFVIDSFLPDESLLYGTSVLQSIAKPQELLNDLTNQNVDAVSWSLDPVMELDPMYASYIDKIKNVTGAVYPFKPGSLSAVNKPMIPSNAFNERSNIKNEIRETTAVDEIIKGISSPSRTTATEVKAQVASAGRRFDIIISQMENGGYYRLSKLVFQLVQMYVTQPTMYRVIGKTGVDWQSYDPNMFKGDYEPRVKLKATLDEQKNKKMRDLKELFTSMLGNPYVEQAALTRIIIQKAFDLEPDEVDMLMVDPQQQAMAQGGEDPKAKKEKTPEQIALEGIAKSYVNTNPDVQAQLEEMAGLQSSIAHEGTMQSLASQHFVDQSQHGADLASHFMPTQDPNAQGMPQGQPTQPMPPTGQMNG